jgi:hypothetical protein
MKAGRSIHIEMGARAPSLSLRRNSPMKNDMQTQRDVLAELDREPNVVTGSIGIEVHHGVVQLAGRVSNSARKMPNALPVPLTVLRPSLWILTSPARARPRSRLAIMLVRHELRSQKDGY